MNLDLAALPVDVDALHRLVRDLAAQAVDDQSELVEARAEVERLRLIIQRLQRTQFGRRSERIDDDQLALGLEDLDADLAQAQVRDPASSLENVDRELASRHRSLHDHLPREEIALDIDQHARFAGGRNHSCPRRWLPRGLKLRYRCNASATALALTQGALMTTLFRSVGVFFFALCMAAPSAYGASQTIPVGGTGGGHFRILCPPRQVLVGFSMRLGSAMDAIGPICARMRKSGKTLRPSTVPAFTGGPGGDGQVVACPFNSFVHNLECLCRSL